MEGGHRGVDEAWLECIEHESEKCVEWEIISKDYSANAEKTRIGLDT